MDKSYLIKLDQEIIGSTNLEKADPPMGVVFGKIHFLDEEINYDFIKSYCEENKIELAYDSSEDKLLSTSTIEKLRVISSSGQEIKGLGNQISGMDSEGFEISIEGIEYPLYGEEFPQHVKEFQERFKK